MGSVIVHLLPTAVSAHPVFDVVVDDEVEFHGSDDESLVLGLRGGSDAKFGRLSGLIGRLLK